MKPNEFEKIALNAIIRTAQMLLDGEAKDQEEFINAIKSFNIPVNNMLEQYK